MEEKKKIIWLQSNYDFEYSDYLEYCEEMGLTPAKDGSMEYYNWCSSENEINYDADRDNLRYSKIADEMFCIKGTLGLWYGTREVMDSKRGLLAAIDKCIGRDGEMVTVSQTEGNGWLDVEVVHHDGTNIFQLHQLNKNGVRWWEAAENRGERPEPNEKWYKAIKEVY